MARFRWAVRCTAWARSKGRPCGHWAIRGGYVCPTHGGKAPQVRLAAQRRLAAAQLERRQRRPLTPFQLQLFGGREERRDFTRYVRTLVAEVKAAEGG